MYCILSLHPSSQLGCVGLFHSDMIISKYMSLAVRFLAVAATTFRVATCGTTVTLSCHAPGFPARVVAGPGEGQWNYTQAGFGTISVLDLRLTETPDPTSKYLGQGRGLSVFDTVGGNNVVDLFMLDFENDQFTGSVGIFGTENLGTKRRVLPISGGSGDFLFIKGYAIIEVMALESWAGFNLTLVYKKAASLDDF